MREVFSNAYFKPKIYRSERIPGAYVAYGRTLECLVGLTPIPKVLVRPTKKGRYLMVAFFRYNKCLVVLTELSELVSKQQKKQARVITARDLTSTERKRLSS